MVQPAGVAVFGCGSVASGHFSAYAAHAKARLVAAELLDAGYVGEDARQSLELVLAAYESIGHGRVIRLPLVPARARV